jgi:hypothetical protein
MFMEGSPGLSSVGYMLTALGTQPYLCECDSVLLPTRQLVHRLLSELLQGKKTELTQLRIVIYQLRQAACSVMCISESINLVADSAWTPSLLERPYATVTLLATCHMLHGHKCKGR